MPASKPDTCAEHDARVLVDAARRLEAAARAIRVLAGDAKRWPIVEPSQAQIAFIRVNVVKALAALPSEGR